MSLWEGTTSSAVLTIDVHDRPNLAAELDHLIEELDGLGLKATVFVPAILVRDEGVRAALLRLVVEGHEIGCHGLTHDAEDSYAHLPEAEQRER